MRRPTGLRVRVDVDKSESPSHQPSQQGRWMSIPPYQHRVPAEGTSWDKGGSAPARLSAGAKLRVRLHASIVRTHRAWSSPAPRSDREPIRAELFSIERLEQHAESLAAAQHI